MIQRIKDALIYVLAPLAFVLGYTYYLLTKNKSLTDQLEAKHTEAKLTEEKHEQESIDTKAGRAVDDYNVVREEFLRRYGLSSSDPGSRQGHSGSEGTDSDSGSKT